jgi:hypothetical protein
VVNRTFPVKYTIVVRASRLEMSMYGLLRMKKTTTVLNTIIRPFRAHIFGYIFWMSAWVTINTKMITQKLVPE